MVLCLFINFLAVDFDWSIILIRKSFGASRHISGKLGVKLAIGCTEIGFSFGFGAFRETEKIHKKWK